MIEEQYGHITLTLKAEEIAGKRYSPKTSAGTSAKKAKASN